MMGNTVIGSAKQLAVWAVASATLALAACSPGDVELNGKLFDAVGGATGLTGKAPGTVRMAERQGLVVPPSLDRLPEPGTGNAAEPLLADIQDPDRKKTVDRAALEREQAAYCKQHYELAKMRGDQNADQATGPLGPCRPSAITAFTNWNKGSNEQ